MQSELQHADPHDAIAAQLRDLAPRLERESPELNLEPVSQDTPATSPVIANEPPLRATPLNDNAGDIRTPAPRMRSGHRVARTLLTVCAVVAALMAWHSYGEEAKQRLSHLAPRLLARVMATTQSVVAAEPQNAASQVAASQPAAEPVSAQAAAPTTPAAPAQSSTATATPAVESPPTQTAIPSELASSIETMTHEIASLKQTVEQLQAGQQQLTRDVAKAAEHETHRKPTAHTSKKPTPPLRRHVSAPAAARRARTPYLPPQDYSRRQTYPQSAVRREANIPPPAPVQLPPQPGDAGVPRPPMPLR